MTVPRSLLQGLRIELGGRMHSFNRAIFVALITFGASLVGMALQWVVPADVLTASKGSVGAMVGLVTLLLALVLGLLVFTAFSVFTTQRDEAFSLGPMVAEVDLALELYGPERPRAARGCLRRFSVQGPASSATRSSGRSRSPSRRCGRSS